MFCCISDFFLYDASDNISVLIKSFASANIDNSKLVIAGGGSEKNRCLNLAKNYTCEIEFIEASLEDVPKIQAKADILLLPLKKGIGKTASPSKLPAYMFSKNAFSKILTRLRHVPRQLKAYKIKINT